MIFTFLTLLQSQTPPSGASATISQTLSSINQSVTADVHHVAAISQTLSPIVQEIDARIPVSAAIDQTLSGITQHLEAETSVPITGIIRQSLSGVFQEVTGQLRIFTPVTPKEPQPNFQESILQLTVKEIYRDRKGFDILQKLANHLKIEVDSNKLSGVVQITREGFLDEFFGRYAVKETGSGQMIGLVKSVSGVMKFISPGLPNEIRILVGQKGVEMVPPKGWEIIDDVDIQNRYNIGNSPNWLTAAIRYVGI